MPKTGARTRAVKKDAVLEAAVDVARAGAEAVAYPRPVGEHVGFEMVSERLATHFFASTDAGIRGLVLGRHRRPRAARARRHRV